MCSSFDDPTTFDGLEEELLREYAVDLRMLHDEAPEDDAPCCNGGTCPLCRPTR